ncbi:DUF2274 domain-containing protein [Hyphomonas atlantica corrig.]|jgi:hypothetical protein|uniref:DUF2274 domain-containing protein n=2 Tax=Hyphomonas TaxID=85 RepID=UPI000DBF7BD2|nr:DUF2274 domain-containing protein [Hyphomonas atlantica]RAN33100.1 hypothetical protein HY11_17070 [Hyphomonas pacifica]|tara:strand:+ start:45444 stop:45707 length:264 start_codon:yes stop_codon:yes gene_type:complete
MTMTKMTATMSLKLERLPDRTPVRMTVAFNPDLAAALADYAAIYQKAYGEEEKPETLIPAMLEMFLASDAGFKRARKALPANARNGD